MIARLPGDKHWQMLARAAMQDDLSGLAADDRRRGAERGRGIAARDALLAAWQERNRRAIERVQQLLGELRAAPAADSAMLAVALRELRNLGLAATPVRAFGSTHRRIASLLLGQVCDSPRVAMAGPSVGRFARS